MRGEDEEEETLEFSARNVKIPPQRTNIPFPLRSNMAPHHQFRFCMLTDLHLPGACVCDRAAPNFRKKLNHLVILFRQVNIGWTSVAIMDVTGGWSQDVTL